MGTEAMHRPIADADEPGLGIRVTSQQTVGRYEDIVGHLISARFDIDSNNLPFVAGFDLRADLAFIELVPTACELFFTIPRSSHGHDFSPVLLGAQGVLSLFPQRYSTIFVTRQS
jgi:hypothetical protein